MRGNRVLEQKRLSFVEPVLDPDFPTVKLHASVPGWEGSDFSVEINRATEELSGPEAGARRLSGLLVRSRRALVDISWFGHENKTGTEYLFGVLDCPFLYQLLADGHSVVSKNRQGLARENEFVRALSAEVTQLTKATVDDEAKRILESTTKKNDPDTEKRNKDLCKELSKIYEDELDIPLEGDTGVGVEQPVFTFESKMYRLKKDKERVVRLAIAEKALNQDQTITVSIHGEGLKLLSSPTITVGPKDLVDGVARTDIRIKGNTEIDDGVIKAIMNEHTAKSEIVIQPAVTLTSDFEFEHTQYRIRPSRWTDIRLRVRPELLTLGVADVQFELENDELEVRPDINTIDHSMARAGWIVVRVQVRGNQVGTSDTLTATMGSQIATAMVSIVAKNDHLDDDVVETGGAISDIRFSERENPRQRCAFRDSVITVFVNEDSLSRYLKSPESRKTKMGKTIAADVIAQAFCRHLAKQKYSQDKLGLGRDPVESVLSLYDRMVRNYAKKIHAVYNP